MTKPTFEEYWESVRPDDIDIEKENTEGTMEELIKYAASQIWDVCILPTYLRQLEQLEEKNKRELK